MKKNKLYQFVLTAFFGAIGSVLMYIEFPLLPSFPFLKFDFSDLAALMAGVYFGPISAIIVEFIKNVIHLPRGFSETLGYGEIMNFVVGCAYVVPFSLLFRKAKTQSYTIKIAISSIMGTISIVAIGVLGNAVITPLYFNHVLNQPVIDLWKTIVYGTIPFNALKGIILSVLSYPFILALKNPYKRIFCMKEAK